MARASHHPDLAARARFLPRGIARRWTLPLLEGLAPRLMALVSSVGEEVALDGCSLFVYRPAEAAPSPRPALLWLHGGGLLFGDARQDEAFVRRGSTSSAWSWPRRSIAAHPSTPSRPRWTTANRPCAGCSSGPTSTRSW